MALDRGESFDHLTVAQLTRKGWTLVGTGVLTTGRFGSGLSGSNNTGSGGPHGATIPCTSSATGVVGVAFTATSIATNEAQQIRLLEGATLHLDVRTTPNGELRVTRNGTSLALSGIGEILINTWYYLELAYNIHDTTGSFTLYKNGVSLISGTNIDTRNGGTGVVTVHALAGVGNSAGGTARNVVFDDYYALSGSTTPLGDTRVEALFPDGAGNSTQWTPSAGSNYQNVDDATPNDDTDYNSSATAGQKDLYTMTGMTPTTGTVHGVQVTAMTRKDDAGVRSVRTVVRAGGSELTGTTVALATSYAGQTDLYLTKPAGGSWAVSDVNGMEAGVEVVT